MRYYKMRAECMPDIGKFLALLVTVDNVTIEHVYIDDHMMPDVICTFRSPNDLTALRTFLAAVPDGHVMLETVALKENYTGEREPVPVRARIQYASPEFYEAMKGCITWDK